MRNPVVVLLDGSRAGVDTDITPTAKSTIVSTNISNPDPDPNPIVHLSLLDVLFHSTIVTSFVCYGVIEYCQ